MPRSEVFVSTKVASRLVPDRTAGPNDGANSSGHGWAGGLSGFRRVYDMSYDGFMLQHTESLQRMGQSHVDGLLIHGPGEGPGSNEWQQLTAGGGFRALQELRSSGAVQAIGCGMGPPCDASVTTAVLDACPSIDYICLAGSFSLLEQPVHDDGILQTLLDKQVGAVIFAPFNSGVLARGSAALKSSSTSSQKFNYFDAAPELIERVEALERVCLRHGTSLAATALQFPLMHPAVCSVVCGVASPSEAIGNAELMETPIPADVWRALKEEGLLPSSLPMVEFHRGPGDRASL